MYFTGETLTLDFDSGIENLIFSLEKKTRQVNI